MTIAALRKYNFILAKQNQLVKVEPVETNILIFF
jgi:hypothetical protein